MRKLGLLLLLQVLLILTAGCGFKDIDKRFFVIAVGIDPGERHDYRVSLKLAIPSPRTEPGESKFQVVSEEADSIAEAVRLMKSKVDKEFDFGQAKIVVIGKAFADSRNLDPSMDWFFRRRDIQQIALFSIGEPDAAAVLNAKPISERLPGNSLILAFTREGTDSPYIIEEPMFDYYRRLKDKGRDAYLPIIRADKETLVINRVAILRGDYKRVELTPEETNILHQMIRGYRRFILKVETGKHSIAFSSFKLDSRYRILTPPRGRPTIRFQVEADLESEESSVPLFDLPWKEVEKSAENKLRDEYLTLLRKLQKNGVDPVGFGVRYRATRHHGKSEFEEWEELYPIVDFDVRVHCSFKGTGVIR